MRLIATPDGTVNRIDRALWLSLPFDLVWVVVITPDCRILRVVLESRSWDAGGETRSLVVAAESRILTVTESRTSTPAAEDRTYEVHCG